MKGSNNILQRILAELKECSNSGNLQRGKTLHEAAIRSGVSFSLAIENELINMYGKCSSPAEARKVFDCMNRRTVVSWTSMILGYADNGEAETALILLTRMRDNSCTPSTISFIAAIKACSNLAAIQENVLCFERGKALHLLASISGCTSDFVVENTLVDMYGRFGRMDYARRVFDQMKHRDVVSWTALIFGYVDNGNPLESLDLFWRMSLEGCMGNTKTFVAAIKACTHLVTSDATITIGRALHLLASETGSDSELYVQTTLVDMYGKCGEVTDAHKVFDSVMHPNVVCWNTLILSYADNGECDMALSLFLRMECAPDSRTFVAALRASIVSANITRAKALHLLAVKTCCNDIYVKNTLVDLYAKLSSMDYASIVFDSIKNKNSVSWNVLIMGYADNGEPDEVLKLFSRMKDEGYVPSSGCFVAVLKVVASGEQVKALHFLACQSGCDSDTPVNCTLVDVYAKMGNMTDARRTFDSSKTPDTMSWNSMISGYAENGMSETALRWVSKMGQEGYMPNAMTFVTALKAGIDIAEKDGKVTSKRRANVLQVLAFRCGCDSEISIQCNMVSLFSKCGDMEDARLVFESSKYPVMCCSVLITGYADNGLSGKALDLFWRMKRQGWTPNKTAFIAALKACCCLGAIDIGKEVHAEICNCGLEHDILSNCLIDFYAKCGSLSKAKHVFDSRPRRNVITWTTLIMAYSGHGETTGLFDLFSRMLDDNVQPNAITFLCVLKGCSHAGLVDKGKNYFEAMKTMYGIDPNVEHYTCMVDIFGRANKLDDAMFMVRNIPFSLDAVTWRSVQGACQKWKNVKLGRLAFESVMCLDGNYSGNYVLMSNIDRAV